MLRATAHLGTLPVEVEAPTLQELLEEVDYIQSLDAAREASPATPFYRDDREGNKYFGFRREDGAEVMFGQHKPANATPGRRLYAYATTSEKYKGWERYDREAGVRVPVGGRPPASHQEEESRPAATPRGGSRGGRQSAPPPPAEEHQEEESRPASGPSTPRGDDRLARMRQEHEAMLEYVKAVGPRVDDALLAEVGGEFRNVKGFVRENWPAMKEQVRLARTAVEAIEAATGIPFDRDTYGGGAAEGEGRWVSEAEVDRAWEEALGFGWSREGLDLFFTERGAPEGSRVPRAVWGSLQGDLRDAIVRDTANRRAEAGAKPKPAGVAPGAGRGNRSRNQRR